MKPTVIIAALFALGCGGSQKRSDPQEATATADPNNPRKASAFDDAARYLLGNGVPQDRGRALGLFLGACEKGEVRACVTWLQVPGHPEDKAAGVIREVWKHCKGGDRRSCRVFLENTPKVSVPVDPAELMQDCERDVAASCSFYAFGLNDESKELPVVRKACELGEPEACWGIWRKDLEPDLRDAALRAHRESCKAEVPLDCARLDSLLGRPQDDARYNERLLRECLALDLTACTHAQGIPSREAHIAVAEILCKIDDQVCQSMHQDIARDDEIVAIDPEDAAEGYERNCVNGRSIDGRPYESAKRARDCVAGAKLYLSKEWPRGPDRGRADALLAQACELDVKALSRDDAKMVQVHCTGSAKSP